MALKFNTSTLHVGHFRSSGLRTSPIPVEPDLGLSTRSLMRRARASGRSVSELVAETSSLRNPAIYRDSQVREFRPTPLPESVSSPLPAPEPIPVPTPAPAPVSVSST